MDLTKISREDWMVGAGGIALLLSLLLFPWFSISRTALHLSAYTPTATAYDGGGWAVLVLIVLFWVVVDLGLARFSPEITVPSTKYGREMTRAFAIGVIVLLLLIRLLWHVGDWGWGRYLDVVLVVVVAVGGWQNAIGRSTPLNARSR